MDLDGLSAFTALINTAKKVWKFANGPAVALFSYTKPLGETYEAPRSLYQKSNFSIKGEEITAWDNIMNVMSIIPGIPSMLGFLYSISPRNEVESSLVDDYSRKAFVNGAETEITRINNELEQLDDNKYDGSKINKKGQSYKEFLDEQKNLLKSELDENRVYDEKYVKSIERTVEYYTPAASTRGKVEPYDDDKWRPSEISKVKPIDYQKIFMEEE
ncbi:hypothetical protein [Brucepastera parasyntrophica]|uniref:hypothetical protein n=1 Tax=Brucepastera parasyntrophica TaxID=2880008 RepID=UPI003F704567